MALGTRRTWRRPGLPEFVALLLLIGGVALAALWWRSMVEGDWRQTAGRVVECSIRPTHYNAPDYQRKVDVAYAYSVGGVEFAGHWSGFWPETHSPNALTSDDLDRLLGPAYPLVVFYNPRRPWASRIDDPNQGEQTVYGWLAVGCFAAAAFYCVRVYPVWCART